MEIQKGNIEISYGTIFGNFHDWNIGKVINKHQDVKKRDHTYMGI